MSRVKRVPRSLHVKNPCNNSLRGPSPKGDWGIEIWPLGLFTTGSKTLAEVGGPFGCAGCINFEVTSGQAGDVISDASFKESATLFAR